MNKLLLLFFFVFFTILSNAQDVNFSAEDNEGCVVLIASFEIDNLVNASFISWDFGNGTILSGNPDINPILLFPTIAYLNDGFYTVSLTYIVDGVTETITRPDYIKAYSIPTINFSADQLTGCGNFEVSFEDESVAEFGTIIDWHWDFGNGFESEDQNPSTNYFEEGYYDVTLQVTTQYGCEAILTENNYINALDGPHTLFEVNSNYACELPFDLEIINTTTSTNDLTYLWDFDNGQSSNEEQPENVTYTEYGLYTITLNALDDSTCSVNYSQTLLIQPMEASFEISYGCAPTWITLNNTSTFGLTDFTWDFGDPGSGDDNFDDNFHSIHYFDAAGLFPITLTAQNDAGCYDTLTIDMNLEEAPFEIIASQNFLCELPASVDITIPTPGISSVSWVLLDSLGMEVYSGSGTSFTLEFPYLEFHSYDEDFYHLSLEIEYDDGCAKEIYLEDYISVVIPKVDAYIEDLLGCIPHTVTFIDSSSFPYGFSEIQWNVGDGNFEYGDQVNYLYDIHGDYFITLTLTTPQGCQADSIFEFPVEVGEPIIPEFSYAEDTICHLDPFTLYYDGPYDVDSLLWLYAGDIYLTPGNIGAIIIPATSICSPIFIELIAYNNGCSNYVNNTLDDLIAIGPQSIIGLNFDVICLENTPTELVITNNSCSLSPGDSILYEWTIFLSDTVVTTTNYTPPPYNIDAPGSYLVQLSSSSTLTSCASNVETYALVDQLSIIPLNDDTYGCHPYQFFEAMYGADYTLGESEFSWTIEWPDSILYYETEDYQYVYPLFPDTGNYPINVTGINPNGCVDTLNYTVRSLALPIADFIIPDSIGCSPSTIQLLDSSYGENQINTWEWDLFGWEGSSSTDQNPYFNLTFPTPYAITLEVSDIFDCTSIPYTQLMYPPLIFAEIGLPDAACNGENIEVSNYSYGSSEPFSYFWEFGNGETSTEAEPNFQYNGVSQTTYFYPQVTITNPEGCVFTYTDSILISVPIFDLSASLDSSSNCPPIFADIVPIGSGDIFSWEIIYGDGDTNFIYMDTISGSFSHVYEIPGYYDVTVIGTDTNQCYASIAYDSLVLIAGPYASFTYDPTGGCPPLDVNFTITDESGVSDFLWVFGDGNVDSIYSPNNIYLNAGIFFPVLVVQDSLNSAEGDTIPCVVAIIGEELIIDGPILEFVVDEDTLCYGGGFVEFTNLTIPINGFEITDWLWDFGDGTTSTEENPPIHEYTLPGSYIVSLLANTSSECEYFIEKIAVVVLAIPQLSPSFDYTIDCAPLPVQFFADTSIWLDGISSIEWTFGDGTTSEEWFPLHYYENYGSYTSSVNYMIFDCPFEFILTDSISTYPEPTAQYVSSPLQDENGIYGQFFENNSIGEVEVEWILDSISISTENSVEIDFSTFPVQLLLVATNEFGCSDSVAIDLWIYYDDSAPNIFTPNGDGVNDFFVLDLSEIKDCVDLIIFNRWGQKIFEANSYQNTWDGKNLNGNNAVDGTYFYVANICGKTTLKGYITLLR